MDGWKDYDLFSTLPDYPYTGHEQVASDDGVFDISKDAVIRPCRKLCMTLCIRMSEELVSWDYIFDLWKCQRTRSQLEK